MKKLLTIISIIGTFTLAFAGVSFARQMQLLQKNILQSAISYWNFNGGNANDYKGINNGTANSVSFSTTYGILSTQGSLYPGGSTGDIAMPSPVISTSSQVISVSLWLKSLSASQGQDVTIFTNQNDTNNYGLIFSRNTSVSNNWGVFYGDGAGHWCTYNANYFPITANVWHFFVVIANGSIIQVWEDGTDVENVNTGCSHVNFANAHNLLIGNDTYGATGRGFNGYIDDVAVYGFALTQAQITDIYTSRSLEGTGISR